MYKFPFILWSIIKGNIFKKQTNKFDIGSNLFHFQKFMSGWWQTRDQITLKVRCSLIVLYSPIINIAPDSSI